MTHAQTAVLRPLEVQLSFPVRTYDIDFSGVVSSIVYLRWLEDLRFAMLARYAALERHLAAGIVPVLGHTAVDYRTPVGINDPVQGRMWVSDLWGGRWGVEAELGDGQRVYASARQSGGFLDLETRHPVRVPEALLELYRAEVSRGLGGGEPDLAQSREPPGAPVP
jgi:acyl-CoA thioester hydrolase